MFDVVVNYYYRPGYPSLVESSAKMALSCYRLDRFVGSIFLVDGSAERNDCFAHWCDLNGIQYLHAGQPLSFAQAYNFGAGKCSGDWIVLSASDVYIPHGFFGGVTEHLSHIDPRSVGCIVPALTSCDIPSQDRLGTRVRRAGLMSLNLNIMPSSVFLRIGGVPAEFSGAFNDVEMSLRIRGFGLSIYQLPVRVLHYGKLTISHGSDYRFASDQRLFFLSRPGLFSRVSLCNLKLDRFQRGWVQWLFRLERLLPLGRLHAPIQYWLWYWFG